MQDILEENFLINSNLVLQVCQNNCLKAEENDVGIKGGMTVECNHDDCIQCGVCLKACREGALRMEDGKIVIDREKCNNCARCVKELSNRCVGRRAGVYRFLWWIIWK